MLKFLYIVYGAAILVGCLFAVISSVASGGSTGSGWNSQGGGTFWGGAGGSTGGFSSGGSHK